TPELTTPSTLTGRVVVDRLPHLRNHRSPAVSACRRDHVTKHRHRTELMIDRDLSTSFAGAREHGAAFVNARGEWLLAQDVRAGVHAGDTVLGVQRGRTRDDHQLRRCFRQQLDGVAKYWDSVPH